MAVISGKYAEAVFDSCNLLEFESWTLTYGAENQIYDSRSGGGAQRSVEGIFRGNGTITGFVSDDDGLNAVVTTGALATLTLYHTQVGSVSATGNARIGQITFEANRAGEPESYSIEFITDGLWTLA